MPRFGIKPFLKQIAQLFRDLKYELPRRSTEFGYFKSPCHHWPLVTLGQHPRHNLPGYHHGPQPGPKTSSGRRIWNARSTLLSSYAKVNNEKFWNYVFIFWLFHQFTTLLYTYTILMLLNHGFDVSELVYCQYEGRWRLNFHHSLCRRIREDTFI